MATTTNYGWDTPDDTDLVKDGAAAIRTLGSSIDTTTKNLNPETTTGDISYRSATANTNTRLAIGSTGQVLTVAAGVPSWASPSDQTPLTTKGDVFTFSTVDARLGVGANGTVLTADSAETTGLKWAAPASSSGPAFRARQSADQATVARGTFTKVQYATETFDTDACYDTTNYRFTPNKAGYYQVNAGFDAFGNSAGNGTFLLVPYKNGATTNIYLSQFISSGVSMNGSTLISMNGTTDYLEIFGYGDAGGTTITFQNTNLSKFEAFFVRSN